MCLLLTINLRISNSSGLNFWNNILILGDFSGFISMHVFKMKKWFLFTYFIACLIEWQMRSSAGKIVQFIDVELVKYILITLYLWLSRIQWDSVHFSLSLSLKSESTFFRERPISNFVQISSRKWETHYILICILKKHTKHRYTN